jgi:hypothetical protein
MQPVKLVPIYDTGTTIGNPAGAGYVRSVFPGNIIPPNRLDKVALNMQQLQPPILTPAAESASDALSPRHPSADSDLAPGKCRQTSLPREAKWQIVS